MRPRLTLGVLLFCLNVPHAIGAPATASPSAAESAQAAADSAQLRDAAHKLLGSGSSADAVQAAELLDKASEIDARDAATRKAEAELKMERPPASGWEPFVVELTPFLSFVIVALTFAFNSYQSRVADQEKREEALRQREADEERRFTDAITLIQKSEDFSPAAALLSTFSTGPYAELARQTAIRVLLHTKSFDDFVDLFGSFVEPISWKNLNQVLDLMRSVSITVGPLLDKAWVDGKEDYSGFSAQEKDTYDLLVQERTFLGAKAASILRQARESLDPVDLNNLGFDNTDLTGADLRNAYIAPASWNLVNLDGADLRGITSFQNGWFYNTAWWHASHIDKPFLEYLAERFPFKPDQLANTPQGISAEEYAKNLERLRGVAT
jgi:hypothetical protein